jgi:hypothetical protein
LAVANNTVEFFCKLGGMARKDRRADLILASRVGGLQSLACVERASSEQANTRGARFGFQSGLQGSAYSQHSANKEGLRSLPRHWRVADVSLGNRNRVQSDNR